jgi:hypothetical protein
MVNIDNFNNYDRAGTKRHERPRLANRWLSPRIRRTQMTSPMVKIACSGLDPVRWRQGQAACAVQVSRFSNLKGPDHIDERPLGQAQPARAGWAPERSRPTVACSRWRFRQRHGKRATSACPDGVGGTSRWWPRSRVGQGISGGVVGGYCTNPAVCRGTPVKVGVPHCLWDGGKARARWSEVPGWWE